MVTKSSALNSDRTGRLQSVQNFNIRTLKTLNYYGGYSTTKTLSQIHQYTTAGVRKRMNSMVKSGWVTKVEHDEGLGRAEQIWCITKSGRIAAQTEQDGHVDASKLKGFSIYDFSPALHSHTGLVQVMANRITLKHDYQEIKPFKLEVKDSGRKRYVYPDIVFDAGVYQRNEKDYSFYDFYEVELTVKSIKRYKDLFIRVALHNEQVISRDDGYIIGAIFYITTPQLMKRLQGVLEKVSSNTTIYLFDYTDVLNDGPLDFNSAKVELPEIKKHELYRRQR